MNLLTETSEGIMACMRKNWILPIGFCVVVWCLCLFFFLLLQRVKVLVRHDVPAADFSFILSLQLNAAKKNIKLKLILSRHHGTIW